MDSSPLRSSQTTTQQMCRGEIKTAVNILKSETIQLNNKLSVTEKYFLTLEVIGLLRQISHLILVLKSDYYSIHCLPPTKLREGTVFSSVVLSVCLYVCSLGGPLVNGQV